MRSFSLYAWWLVVAIYVLAFYRHYNWKDGIVNGGDTWGYYAYLPAAFVYGDLNDNIQESYKVRKQYHGGYAVESFGFDAIGEAPTAPNGKRVIKYTMGVALLQAPFFGMAHLIAPTLGYPQDGYSLPYMFLVHFSTLFFALWGLWIIRRTLLRNFSEPVVAWVLIAVGLATNLYYFSLQPMSHAYLFFLYAVLIYNTIAWYQDGFRIRNALLVGLSAGCIVLIRPVEIVCLLIPILYNCVSLATFKTRWAEITTHWKGYAMAILAFVAVGIPQILYWRWVSGDFLYYSYTNEKFDFLHPKIKEGLFYFQNGWLAYTPIMYVGLLGCLVLWKQHRQWFLPILLLLPLHIYITYSWWCWQYINGFGSRPMVDIYAVMAIVLAVSVQFFGRWWSGKIVLAGVLVFFSFLNIFNTYQFYLGILWSENANFQYYKRIFGKTSSTYLDLITYDTGENQPDSTQLKLVKTLGQLDMEDSTKIGFVREPRFEGNFSFQLYPEAKESPSLDLPMRQLNQYKGQWLRISVWARKAYDGIDIYRMAVLIAAWERANPRRPRYRYAKWTQVRLDNKIQTEHYILWGGKKDVWGQIHFWTQIPSDLSDEDTFHLFGKNDTPNSIWIDNIRVELYEKIQ